MKDKITFFVLGAIVVILTLYINNTLMKDDNITTKADKNATFDSVTIKGELIIGSEGNFIMLTSDKENNRTDILLESKGSIANISADPESSSITMAKQIGEFTNIGVTLIQQQRPQGNLTTHLLLKDSNGVNVIRTTD